MRKLKLLLIIRDFSQWLWNEPYYLANELSEITDLAVWHEPGNIQEILNNIPFVPDFILIYFYRSAPSMSPPISGLESLEIPYGVYLEDLHNLNNLQESVVKDNVQHIFACYRDSFFKTYPNLTDKFKWLPHHVNTNIFKDYGLRKDIKMLMMGAVFEYYYPLRHKILQTLNGNKDFVYHSHPGYRDINEKEGGFVKDNYAQEINRAQLFFTCDSILKYPVQKYFEIPACHTLLLASDSPELYDLGFRAGENFVAINEDDFVEKAEYYLHHNEERERIAKNGYQLVHERHSTAIRAKELLAMINGIIGD